MKSIDKLKTKGEKEKDKLSPDLSLSLERSYINKKVFTFGKPLISHQKEPSSAITKLKGSVHTIRMVSRLYKYSKLVIREASLEYRIPLYNKILSVKGCLFFPINE